MQSNNVAQWLRRVGTLHASESPSRNRRMGCPRAAGEFAVDALWHLLGWLFEGRSPSFSWNFHHVTFLPKELSGEELVFARRDAAATRPIGLKTAPNKLCATIVNWQIKRQIAKHAQQHQRGFVCGRQLGQTALDLDVAARLAQWHAHRDRMLEEIPLILPLDFGSAFPSLLRDFLRRTWQRSGAPAGLLCFLDTLDLLPWAFARVGSDGAQWLLWQALRGVVQGCPSSGSS